jgi:MFS family permease
VSDVAGAAAAARAARRPSRYRDVLRQREFRGLVLAQVVSECGENLARVALAALILARSDSVFLAASVFAVSFLPTVLGSALLGPLTDRLPRRTILLACDGTRALVVAALAAVAVDGTPLWALLGLLLVAELFSAPFDVARAAIVPDILPAARDYFAGVGLQRVLFQVDQVLGLALAGVVVVLLSPRLALAANAGTFLVSVLLVWLLVLPRPAAAEGSTGLRGLVADFREGAGLVFADPVRRILVLTGWGAAVFLIAPEGVALAYARAQGMSEAWGGALLAAVPAGAAVGAVLVGRLEPQAQVRAILPLAALGCLPMLATWSAPPVPVALLLWLLCGACQGFMVTVIATVNLVTPAAYRGRVNGLAGAGFAVASATAFLLAGFVADLTSPATAVAAAGAAGIAVVAVLRLVWPTGTLRAAVTQAYALPSG